MIDFDVVQTALEQLRSDCDAAESHGTLCALLTDNCSMADWLGLTLDDLPDPSDVLAQERLSILKQFFEESREQINTDDLGFELLLPDDSDDFAIRLLALSRWCQGFLYGIGVLGEAKTAVLDQQSQECLSDLLEISKLDHREVDSDEGEQQLVEISEHVRMSIILINESMNPVMPAPELQ
jgi:uncharacterized protein YgfB (UPF0149 family)